jgi:hypothetical protein
MEEVRLEDLGSRCLQSTRYFPRGCDRWICKAVKV